MSKGRLEAFSDAIFAIVMTIMVLELTPPAGAALGSLASLLPKVLTYAFSFLILAIYWVNHHHLFQAVQRVNGSILWANMHLLFWLSLVPFVTAWAGDHGSVPVPVAAYGLVLLLAAVAYYILVQALLAAHGTDSKLASAIGGDTKGKLSVLIYAVAIAASFFSTVVGWALYITVALVWLVPDKRIENTFGR